jgi:AbrB family looped-hinge helix DNA binding protein
MKTVVSERGQVTIPKAVRDTLGLRPGTVIDVVARGGKLIASKRLDEDAFRKWRGRGRLPRGRSVDDYLAKTRGG